MLICSILNFSSVSVSLGGGGRVALSNPHADIQEDRLFIYSCFHSQYRYGRGILWMFTTLWMIICCRDKHRQFGIVNISVIFNSNFNKNLHLVYIDEWKSVWFGTVDIKYDLHQQYSKLQFEWLTKSLCSSPNIRQLQLWLKATHQRSSLFQLLLETAFYISVYLMVCHWGDEKVALGTWNPVVSNHLIILKCLYADFYHLSKNPCLWVIRNRTCQFVHMRISLKTSAPTILVIFR